MRKNLAGISVVILSCGLCLSAQQSDSGNDAASANTQAASAQPDGSAAGPAASATGTVPRLVKFSGVVKDAAGKVHTGEVALTLSLYEEHQGGSPLWVEMQNVQLDEQGRYTVLLGATQPEGLPLELFTTGKARWLGVQPQIEGAGEQPRVLLVGMPYALKAADADTLGGKPASAFLTVESQSSSVSGSTATNQTGVVPTASATAGPPSPSSQSAGQPAGKSGGHPAAPCSVTTDGTAMANQVAKFVTACAIGKSALFESGGQVGIGNTSPGATLDITTTATAPNGEGTRSTTTVTPSAPSSGLYEGARGQVFDVGAANKLGTLVGVTGFGMSTSTQNVDNLFGFNGQAVVSKSAGTVTNAIGAEARAVAMSGTVTNAFGMFAAAQGGITNAFGLYSVVSGLGSGTPTNAYGLYIPAMQATSARYGIYQAGTGDLDFFAGNVGLGTKTPAAKLEVAGTAKVDANLMLGGSINGGLVVQPNNTSPNVIGGFSGNSVAMGVSGATIGGGGESGLTNSVTAGWGTVGGGENNIASGFQATVAGGHDNTAGVARATVGGGTDNTASGAAATVPGGQFNVAQGFTSFAAGNHAQAAHNGAFVWGDDSTTDTVFSTGTNQFVARAAGGVTFYSSSNLSTGVNLAPGSGSWSSLSDRRVKTNFTPVDGHILLARLAALPISTWNYKAQPSSIHHLGPMAQDFRAAFGLGEDDKHISTVDSEGVALAAIQELYKRSQESEARGKQKDAQIERQAEQIRRLTARLQVLQKVQEQMASLQTRLARLEAAPRILEANSAAHEPVRRRAAHRAGGS